MAVREDLIDKVLFKPSQSISFDPVDKKQMVPVEVANFCETDVAIKFRNTAVKSFYTVPVMAKMRSNEKMIFKCYFNGCTREHVPHKIWFAITILVVARGVEWETVFKKSNDINQYINYKRTIPIVFSGMKEKGGKGTHNQSASGEKDEEKEKEKEKEDEKGKEDERHQKKYESEWI
ncbi:unnamed protein product [Caenorhabditis sp. 36 PRJEB53466]|nr:unnamed protein product [Caenorhabditis sp. 36 PRJEB53466]